MSTFLNLLKGLFFIFLCSLFYLEAEENDRIK